MLKRHYLLFIHSSFAEVDLSVVLPHKLEEVGRELPYIDAVVQIPPLRVVVLDIMGGVKRQMLVEPV